MKFKDIKRYLTISKDEINRYISHVTAGKQNPAVLLMKNSIFSRLLNLFTKGLIFSRLLVGKIGSAAFSEKTAFRWRQNEPPEQIPKTAKKRKNAETPLLQGIFGIKEVRSR